MRLREKCKEEGAKMAGGQSEVEMQPLQHGEGQEKRHYWDNVFRTLAEADGDEVDHVRTGGVPTIHIRNLKDFLMKEKSLKVKTAHKTITLE